MKTPMRMTAFAIAALATIGAAPRDWQGPVAPPAADLELAVTRFFETAEQYFRTFRNLTVEETRVNEEFNDIGRVKRRRETVADLLVYRPARSGDSGATEYRDVRLVDGKEVAQRGKRALDLITRATTSASLEEEFRLIDRESRRYDFNRSVGGFTISQLPRVTMRKDFRFTWVGPARLNGHDVIELEYREVVPRAQYGIERVYKGMGITSYIERGHLWLDATTYQLRRSRWEIAGTHEALPGPVVLVSSESSYVESRFGILVPARIVFEWQENVKSRTRPVFARAARMTFTYGAFRQFGVATDETIATP